MEIEALKESLKKAVTKLENKFPYASAFIGSSPGRQVLVSNKEKKVILIPPTKGLTLTVFDGRHFHERSTNDLSDVSINKAVTGFLNDPIEIIAGGLTIDPGPKMEKDFKVPMEIDPFQMDLREFMDAAEKIKDRAMAISSKIALCQVKAGNQQNREIFVNRNKVLYQELNRWDLVFMVVLKDEKDSIRIWGGNSLHGGFELMQLKDEELTRILRDGENLLSAGRIKPGTYDCIFSPEMSGVFAHEAFGHGTETDMYLKQRAKGQEYMGKQVAAPIVDMYDSPAYPGQAGSFFFDHEGQLASETQIIRKGILESGMTDLNSAVRLNYKRTPNGRRENFGHKTYARMTNTYFAPGKDSLEDMIKSIEHGFFVDHCAGGMEDPKGWGIQVEALYAREIKDGRLVDNYFTPIIVTGYVPDLLNSITMIGPDIELEGMGYCGKGWKEIVKVSTGGPFMKLKARLA